MNTVKIGTCHPPSPLYVSRAAALAAGIPHDVPISTVNRLCSSGLMAIRNIAHAIQAGETSIGLAVGVENMTLKLVPSNMSWPKILTLELSVRDPHLQFPRQWIKSRKLMTAYKYVCEPIDDTVVFSLVNLSQWDGRLKWWLILIRYHVLYKTATP